MPHSFTILLSQLATCSHPPTHSFQCNHIQAKTFQTLLTIVHRDRREVLYYVEDIVRENIRWKIQQKPILTTI